MQHNSTLRALFHSAIPVFALIAALLACFAALRAMLTNPSHTSYIAGRLLIADTALLGFTVTGLSILVAVSGRELGQKMLQSGHYRHLIHEASLSVRLLFSAMVLGLASMLTGSFAAYPAAAMAGFLAAALVYLASTGSHFLQVLRHVS